MSVFSELKQRLYNKKIQQCLAVKKVRKATNLKDARSVGVLFDASNSNDAKVVLNYSKELKRQGKKVILMAYKNTKMLDGNEPYPCFCNKDLGMSMIPKTAQAQDFIARKFDLLIALHTQESLPLEYIATASSAKFRVGYYRQDKTHCYDFMVYGKSGSLRAYIHQLESYMKKIN